MFSILFSAYYLLRTSFAYTRKEKWRADMEVSLKEMIRKKDINQLYGNDLRNAAYKGQIPLFTYMDDMHRMDIVRSTEPQSYHPSQVPRGDDKI